MTPEDKMDMNSSRCPFLTQDSGDVLSCSNISHYTVTFLSCLYTMNTMLGLTLNILVLWAIWPEVKRSHGLPTYVISLLCAALLECLTLPFGVAYLSDSLEVGSLGCHVLSLMPKIAQRTATTFVMWIFVLRYVAVTHPLKYATFCSGRVCASVSISLWLTVTAISVTEQALAIDNSNICFPGYRIILEWALIDLILSVLFSHVPLIHLCTCGYLISCTLKNSPSVPRKQHKRISRLLFLAVVMFGILFCPMHIVLEYQSILVLLGQSIWQAKQTFIFHYHLMFALNSLSVVIVPFFYVFSSSAIKKRLKGLFKHR
ncbi:ovarian cancer G-protein coupled receptor 1-like [Pseudophryne corroboree]|uniref:ovarian cancer G-protein coupled receptor 1-like n=1 Tax=Pseudophryne corroboree TaxID=495146 RepID=UPI0030820B1C